MGMLIFLWEAWSWQEAIVFYQFSRYLYICIIELALIYGKGNIYCLASCCISLGALYADRMKSKDIYMLISMHNDGYSCSTTLSLAGWQFSACIVTWVDDVILLISIMHAHTDNHAIMYTNSCKHKFYEVREKVQVFNWFGMLEMVNFSLMKDE
jgi:hypothetical protein